MRISNEFASVQLHLDQTGNGPRIRVTDERTGRERFLDPLELESIVWAEDAWLAAMVDPAAGRWRDDDRSRALTVVREETRRVAGGDGR